MAFDDEAAVKSSKIRPGMSVKLRDLKSAAHLNGLVGRVLHLDEATQRWQVDIGKVNGVKALRPDNLVPCHDDSGEEEDNDGSGGSDAGVAFFKDAAPGDLIRKLLQGRGQSDAEDDHELPAEDRSEDWFAEGDQEGGLSGSDHQIGSQHNGLSDVDVHPEGNDPEADATADKVPPGKRQRPTIIAGKHDFSSFAVRDLKEFLTARGVGISAGITEKGELITLCERASNMPLKQTQQQFEKPVTPTATVPDDRRGSNSNASPRRRRRRRNRAEATQTKAAPESSAPQPPQPPSRTAASSSVNKAPHGSGHVGHAGHHDGAWDHGRGDLIMPPPYGGAWNHGATPPPPGMAWHGYGVFHPLMHPGHMPPGPGYGPPGGYGAPPGYGPVAAGPPPPQYHQPRTREEAVARAEERLRYRRPAEETVALISRFVRDYNLCDEVDLGLRLLRADRVRHLTSSNTIARRLREAGDANEVVLAELHADDPDAAGIVQALRSGSRPDRSKGGRRERRRERERGRGVHAVSAGDGDIRRRSRSGRRRRRQPSEPIERPRRREPRTAQEAAPSEPPASRPSGVWAAGVQHSGNAGGRGTGRDYGGSSGSQEKEMEAWLLSLGSHGALLPYLGPLCREFGELRAVAAALLPKPSSSSVVGKIDPLLWATLGVESLGHRLLLAKGIVALAKGDS